MTNIFNHMLSVQARRFCTPGLNLRLSIAQCSFLYQVAVMNDENAWMWKLI